MLLRALIWFAKRYRPREGWLAFSLLVLAVATVLAGVLAVGWVPEDNVIIPAAGLGLLLGTALAKRPLRSRSAWLLLTLYGLLVPTIWLARPLPPLTVLLEGWRATRQFWLQNGALFLDRAAGWSVAVFQGGSSQETVVFALGLGETAWFSSAYVGWSTFRQKRPLAGLTVMGVVAALNGYYGAAPIHWIVLFVGLAALAASVFHYVHLEEEWEQAGVDYFSELRLDLLFHAGGISLALLTVAAFLPAFSITGLSRLVLQQPAMVEAEETLSRVFAGVEQPRRAGLGVGPGGAGGSNPFPRAFLLGNAPELSETVVMTATVSLENGIPVDSLRFANVHWRALSYDIYTGRGWAISEERTEVVAANEPIPLPSATRQTQVQQNVHWLLDERSIRYTLGQPLAFAQEVEVSWRGLRDLVRVRGNGVRYTAVTRVTTATPDELRTADFEAIPLPLLSRYTELPGNMPSRIVALAQEVAGDAPTAYDKARALEQFLRQYSYSLDAPAPPPNSNPIDFFLFESQVGYCDYYASAMVVMARSLGLPARLGVGYLAQPADANGVQTIHQINGHSWAEIYFGDYGWVEFEPTAAFASTHSREETAVPPAAAPENQRAAPATTPPPLPEPEQKRPFLTWWMIPGLVVFLTAAGWWLWRRQPARALARQNAVLWAYHRLQRNAEGLGVSPAPSQTPQEFTHTLLARLEPLGQHPWLARWTRPLPQSVRRLADLFAKHQYSPHKDGAGSEAQLLWRRLRRPLWLARLVVMVRSRIM